jgi:deoxyadenosine/deoxycytidine kinase
MIIVIESVIAAGKTTLIAALKDYCDAIGTECIVYDEPINRDFLKLYVSNIRKYAFPFQVIIGRERIALLERAIEKDSPEKIILLDRGICGDAAFALMQYENGYFTDQEYEVYKSLTDNNFLKGDFQTIYLRCSPEKCFERMKKRGEEQYTLEYLAKLHEVHEELLGNCCRTFEWDEDRDYIPDGICGKILFNL